MNKMSKFAILILLFSIQVIASLPDDEPVSIGELTWSAGGRLQVEAELWQRPTSIEGHVVVNWAELSFYNILRHQESGVSLLFDAALYPQDSASGDHPPLSWSQVALVGGDQLHFSMGLLLDPVVAFTWNNFQYSALSNQMQSGFAAWGLIPESDQAVNLEYSGFEFSSLGLQISNGEGWPQKEKGQHPDYEIYANKNWQWSESQLASQIFYRHGYYDQLSDNQNQKKRLGIQLTYQNAVLQFGSLLAQLQDAVDGLDGQAADQVSLSNRGGLSCTGQFVETWGVLRLSPESRWKLFAKILDYQIDPEQSGKSVNRLSFGFVKRWARGMDLSMTYEDTRYGQNYAPTVTDKSRWFVAWSWAFAHENKDVAEHRSIPEDSSN